MQAELALEGDLVPRLFLKGIGGVVDGDGGSVSGSYSTVSMPLRMPVSESARARSRHVQTLAVVGGLYLLRVGGADGGDVVGKDDAALDERTHAVELKLSAV